MHGIIPRIAGYLQHRLKARSKYDIHSPFAYRFYKEVLKNKEVPSSCREIEKLLSRLKNDPGYICMTDFGAGSKESPLCRKVTRINRMVRRSSVSQKYGRLLFRIARELQPGVVLEFGTSLGISTAYLAAGAPESMVTTIEGCEQTAALARKNFESLGLANVRVIGSRFEDVLSYLLPELGVVDLVFFDGDHRRDSTLLYFESCLPFITDHTVFVFDDIHWSEEMEQAWEEIRKRESVRVTIDLYRMGIVFFREGLAKEDFILRF
jgi:predicted O-methyltransferase YrrM